MLQANDLTITRTDFSGPRTCGLCESAAYLKAARQSRLCAMASRDWPEMRATYVSNAKLWLAVARDARSAERYFGHRIP
jgi:hypothetical protein